MRSCIIYNYKLFNGTIFLLFFFSGIYSQSDSSFSQQYVNQILSMSLDELMNTEVISISKKSESFKEAAASIYILTEEDIYRSGATKIQDVLNLVPGSWFQEANYNNSVNSFRTLPDEFPQSFLVILDGVPIWTSMTGGPVYSFINVPVKHIKKIEVIKGPGGSIYGANANTGIINIYTKKAEDYDGFVISGDIGNINYINPYFAYSKEINSKIDVSAFLEYKATDGYKKNKDFTGSNLIIENGASDGSDTTITNAFKSDETDGLKALSAGINIRTKISNKIKSSTSMFLSDVESKVYTYSAIADSLFLTNDGATDYNISQRFDLTFNKNHSLFFNTFYRNQSAQVANNGLYEPKIALLNFEIQDNIIIAFNDISFGANYSSADFSNITANKTCDLYFVNPNRTELLYSYFIQDKIHYKDFLHFIIGLKGETWTLVSNKPEFSYSSRLNVNPSKKISLWAAVSKSITTPGFFHVGMERYIADISGDNSVVIALIPNSEIKPTEYRTVEFGVRSAPSSQISFDLSTFHSSFNNAISVDDSNVPLLFSGGFDFSNLVPSVANSYMTVPVFFTNVYKGSSYGGEAVIKIFPTNNFRLETSYSSYFFELEGLDVSGGTVGEKYDPPTTSEPRMPEHIFRFRLYLDSPDKDIYFTANGILASESYRGQKFNYITQLPDDINGIYVNKPSPIFKLDLMIEKKFYNDKLSARLWGRNILANPYVEFFSEYYPAWYPQTIHRTFGGGITYKIH